MLELPLSGRAAGGVLTHADGRVALVRLAHLALLAVVIQAGVFRNKSTARCESVAGIGEQTQSGRRKKNKKQSAICGCLSRETERPQQLKS